MAHHDGAHAAEAAGGQGADLRGEAGGGGLGVGLELGFQLALGLGDVREVVGDGGGEGRVQFLVDAVVGGHGGGVCSFRVSS